VPLTPARLTRYLSTTDYFKDVEILDLSAIANRFEVVSISRGETLFKEGSRGEAWYIIVEGGIDLFGNTPSGESLFLVHLNPGDGFGEIALLENVPRTATATASETTILARLPRAAFERQLRGGNPAAAMMLHAIAVRMSSRLRALSRSVQGH
jgi:CRP/FNR family cyclic AMP-dependent transcriptional regulator